MKTGATFHMLSTVVSGLQNTHFNKQSFYALDNAGELFFISAKQWQKFTKFSIEIFADSQVSAIILLPVF